MPEVIGKIVAISDGLFGVIFGIVLVVVAVVGFALRKRLQLWLKVIVAIGGTVGFLAWSNYFLFPYPPFGDEQISMIAGWEYSAAAKNLIEARPQYKEFSRQRLNGELVAAFGGDVEQVWVGESMDWPKYLGQLAIIAVLFAVSSLLPKAWRKK